MSLAAACKLFLCFIPLRLAAPSNHSYLNSDAPQQPVTETIPAVFMQTTSYLPLLNEFSRNLAADESNADFNENIEADLFNVENTFCYDEMEWFIDEWLKTVDNAGQSPVSNENLAAERGAMDFEAMLRVTEPNAVQTPAATSDALTDQPELWNSKLDGNAFTTLISRNALAADLDQLERIEQKPINSYGTVTLHSSPLLTGDTAQFPSDLVNSSRNNRVSGDFSSIPSTDVDSRSLSILLQSRTTNKLWSDVAYQHGSASGSSALSTLRPVDLELRPNSYLSIDPFTSQGATGGPTVSNLIVNSAANTTLVSDTSDKCIAIRQLKKKLEIPALHWYNPIPSVLNHVPIGKANVTAPLHFITKQSTSPKKPTKKLTTSQPDPTQTSVRTGLTTVSLAGTIPSAQASCSTKSTKELTCGRCGKLFFAYRVFKKHLSSHNKKGEYRCNWPDCGIHEKSYKRLSQHYLQHMPKSDIRKCEECGKTFDSLFHSNLHKQRVHTKGELCF
ncbi:unnamed protein product [Gongylonema pulchrum]|uniref:C2H2-type domain-containing protein n=1 Tax=Gongylonema pulchrum TaxID=637853 RepID=A0A183DXK5_9BILA|nr:unnamed protein product [Gongylonema pulchrum]